MDKADTKGLLGFAIRRTDHTEQESYWLEGQKRFKSTDPGLPPGSQVPTNKHPIQSFLWADYTAKPDHSYTYEVTALRGSPADLLDSDAVSLTISTESVVGNVHDVFFNRGAISSQAYVSRFGDRSPDDVGQPAFDWLSRGLFEALIAFIGEASGSGYGLRAAMYEFQYDKVLEAFGKAKAAEADVKIIYDDKNNTKKEPKKENEKAIADARIKGICQPRTANPSYIAHNKFIVLLKDGEPVSVWTGSTNITENGIFGHLNVGHVVRDAGVAKSYLEYWQQLADDPDARDLKPWTTEQTPAPADLAAGQVGALVFSPRSDLGALDWYTQMIAATSRAVFLTGAFGVPAPFVDVLSKPAKEAVRYLVLDKAGQNANAKTLVGKLRRVPGNQIVVANLIRMNEFDEWLKEEANPLSQNVAYLHTKFLVADPLGDDPWVVTGSANFSEASTTKNDENMVVVRGNTRLCDIYLGEFMRTFSHYSFRDWAASVPKSQWHDISWLAETDAWVDDFFTRGKRKTLEREYFGP
jgi:phosphatidylserine/phosphatidylglycerophosphate/cardiolipin synthase-like enzyme